MKLNKLFLHEGGQQRRHTKQWKA